MIDVLGIGAPSERGGWRFRRVCACLETGELTVVISADRQARRALLDAVTARQIPTEGRVWIDGCPVMPETVRVVRARVGEIDLQGPLADDRSLLWNVLLVPDRRPATFRTWLRLASSTSRQRALGALRSVGLQLKAHGRVGDLDPWSRRRVLVARALVRRPRSVVVPEVDQDLAVADAADILGLLRTLARCERLTVLVSATHPVLVQLFADRVLVLAHEEFVLAVPPGVESGDPPGPRALAKTG